MYGISDKSSDPPEAQPKRVAADETAVKTNGGWSWVYAAIYLDTELVLGVDLFGTLGTDLAVAFLYGLSENHGPSDGPQKPWFPVCPQDASVL